MGSPFAKTRLSKGSVAGGRLPGLIPLRSSSDLTLMAVIGTTGPTDGRCVSAPGFAFGADDAILGAGNATGTA
jgi:hypothetical protein